MVQQVQQTNKGTYFGVMTEQVVVVLGLVVLQACHMGRVVVVMALS